VIVTRLIRRVVWTLAWGFISVTILPITRIRARGRRHIPRRGAGLLVANHVTFLDPATIGWASLRQLHGVGTDQVLRVPVVGPLVPWFSVIPFAKGMKDRAAMEEVQRRIDNGSVVLIFPEGNRSWTGGLGPVGEGIGRLALRLGVPVLFCRQTTGHLHWPRWAKYPRLVPIHMEFTETVTYTADMSPKEVTADIARRIAIDPEEHRAPRWSWGARLAHGLPGYLWACPACFERSGLELDPQTRGNGVRCRACERRWRVDLSCRLNPADGGPDVSIAAAHAAVVAHYGEIPVTDPVAFHATGVALEGEVELVIVHRGKRDPISLGTGILRLRAESLWFDPVSGEQTTIVHVEIRAVLMQLGDQLQVRTAGTNYGIRPRDQSRFLWKHFIDRHVAAARQDP